MIQQQGESESGSQRYGRDIRPVAHRRNTRVVIASDVLEELSRGVDDAIARVASILQSGNTDYLLVEDFLAEGTEGLDRGADSIGGLNWEPEFSWHEETGYDR